jgi:hypothetical protein
MAGFVEVARAEEVPSGAASSPSSRVIRSHWLMSTAPSTPSPTNAPSGGGEWLGDGEPNLDRTEWPLECLRQGRVFDVPTAEVLEPPAVDGVRTYRVKVEAGGFRSHLIGARPTVPPHFGRRPRTACR